jgi:hypothetical protein
MGLSSPPAPLWIFVRENSMLTMFFLPENALEKVRDGTSEKIFLAGQGAGAASSEELGALLILMQSNSTVKEMTMDKLSLRERWQHRIIANMVTLNKSLTVLCLKGATATLSGFVLSVVAGGERRAPAHVVANEWSVDGWLVMMEDL